MQNIFIKTILVGFFVMIGCQNSFPLTVIHDNEGTVRHSDEPKMQANNYYVSSTGRTADFDRLYGKYIGDRISDVNPMTFNPGDTIRFYGSVTDEVIDNPGIGSCSRPIVFMGFSSLLSNSGEIRNTGVEFTISADPVDNKDFRWHTDITLTHNKGIYNSIPTPTHRQQQAGSNANTLFYMIEGEKLGTMWGYYCDGVWQQDEVDAAFVDADGNTTGKTNGQTYKVKAGNTKLRDVNKDGKYNISDQGIIGCGQPTFNWGWNNSLYFNNFDLSFFVVGFHGSAYVLSGIIGLEKSSPIIIG
jgi:hypothetical protein